MSKPARLPPARTSFTEILPLVRWNELPAEAKPIARLLADGFSQKEIAAFFGLTTDDVCTQVTRLRVAMIEQALEHADELAPELVRRLEALKSGVDPRRRNLWPAGESQVAADFE